MQKNHLIETLIASEENKNIIFLRQLSWFFGARQVYYDVLFTTHRPVLFDPSRDNKPKSRNLAIKLQLNDVFNTYRQQMTQYDALSAVSVNKIYDTRDLSLTIRYNFNSARSRYKGRGAANSEKERF